MSTFSRSAAFAAFLACVGCGADLGGGVLVDQAPTTTPSSPAESDDHGFPCDVHAMLEKSCAPCHAGDMYVVALTTRDVWLSPRSNGTAYGQYAADQVAAEKMPPPTAVTQPSPGDRALLAAWVAAGMPAGPCGALTPPAR